MAACAGRHRFAGGCWSRDTASTGARQHADGLVIALGIYKEQWPLYASQVLQLGFERCYSRGLESKPFNVITLDPSIPQVIVPAFWGFWTGMGRTSVNQLHLLDEALHGS